MSVVPPPTKTIEGAMRRRSPACSSNLLSMSSSSTPRPRPNPNAKPFYYYYNNQPSHSSLHRWHHTSSSHSPNHPSPTTIAGGGEQQQQQEPQHSSFHNHPNTITPNTHYSSPRQTHHRSRYHPHQHTPFPHAYAYRSPPPYPSSPGHPRPFSRPRPPDYRSWVPARCPRPPPHCERFKVLSYNILADYLARNHRSKLYFHIPRHIMDWEWRKRKLLVEFGLWSPDIMCLQEVDRFPELQQELSVRGYEGVWKMRTGAAVDGCATFWRANRFHLVHEEHIEFNKLGLRDNVAQICVLKSRSHLVESNHAVPSPSNVKLRDANQIVVCNIHVLYNPKRGEIKLGQVRNLINQAHSVSKCWNGAPVIICGDFNSTPKSPLYDFISDQKLDFSGIPRDHVSGQYSCTLREACHVNNLQGIHCPPGINNEKAISVEPGSSIQGPANELKASNGTVNLSVASPQGQTTNVDAFLELDVSSQNRMLKDASSGHATMLDVSGEFSKGAEVCTNLNKSSACPSNASEDYMQFSMTKSGNISEDIEFEAPNPTGKIIDGSSQLNVSIKEGKVAKDTSREDALDGYGDYNLRYQKEHLCCTSSINEVFVSKVASSRETSECSTAIQMLSDSVSDSNLTRPWQDTDFRSSDEPIYMKKVESFSSECVISSCGTLSDMDSCKNGDNQLDNTNISQCLTDYSIKSHESSVESHPGIQRNQEEKCQNSMEDISTISWDNNNLVEQNSIESFLVEDSDAIFPAELHVKVEDSYDSFLAELHGKKSIDEFTEVITASNNNPQPFFESTPGVWNHMYDPSRWTPLEIEVASGDSECSAIHHELKLKSAYTEYKDFAGTKDSNGEPQVTSYNRLFMGTVDYIWFSEGLQTVKVLDTIPKVVLQQTSGFPTTKWGSDHLAIACEFVFSKDPA